MDIQPLINALSSQISGSSQNPFQLKPGQLLDVKVAQINSEINRITLELANQTIEVRSNLSVPLQSGQPLKLEVIQLLPTLLLKLVEPKLTETALTFSQVPGAKTNNLPNPSGLLTAPSGAKEQNTPTQLLARVVDIKDQSIRLEVLSKPQNLAGRSIELPYKTGDLLVKPGQLVTLETGTSNTGRMFRIISAENEIAEFVKRFLPKNESPAVAVNQLIKDNAGLQTSETVSIALKRLASDILRDLPRHEDLMQGGLFKRIFSESGLFLEAKLAQLTSAADPNKQTASGLETEAMPFKDDLKAHLLKLIQALKQETTAEAEQAKTTSTLEQLKNLLQKSENSLARLILDQLASVPKEDSPKQQWHIEIPFLNHEQADSIKIELDKDQHSKQDQSNETWTVTLSLSPPNIGPLRCKIAYFDNTVNTHFFTEKPEITDLIKCHLDYLRRQLEQSGLKTGHIEASDGLADSTINRFSTNSLVDEKA